MPLSFHYRRLKGNNLGSVCNHCQRVITSWTPVNWPEHQRLEGKKAGPKAPLIRGMGWVVNFESVHNRHLGHFESAKRDPKICPEANPNDVQDAYPFDTDPLVGIISFESVGDYKAMRVLAQEEIERAMAEALKPQPVAEAATTAG